jgi:hypothetical protein
MERRIATINDDLIKDQSVRRRLYYDGNPFANANTNPIFEKFAKEGYETFFEYLESLGISHDPDLITISSYHHYYYDADDFKKVKTVVHLKELNYLKQIKVFLHNICHILPHNSFFIGSFIDTRGQNGFFNYRNTDQAQNEISGYNEGKNMMKMLPFLNAIYSIMDSNPGKYLTGRSVRLLLEESSLKILDMTEMKGLTYFYSQKV